MAEGVFRDLTRFDTGDSHPLIARIDSCGTGAYHAGDSPDSRTMSVLRENGITTYKHHARKIRVPDDFNDFDFLLAMDDENLTDLRDMVKRAKERGLLTNEALEKVRLYGSFGGKSEYEEVGDPYYGGRDGFETAFEQVKRFGEGFLESISEKAAQES
jgi:low molecular weight phosphotyrosine protein phosphatase